MEEKQSNANSERKGKNVTANNGCKKTSQESLKKQQALKQTAAFKQKYFDYYDDIKISAREDW